MKAVLRRAGLPVSPRSISAHDLTDFLRTTSQRSPHNLTVQTCGRVGRVRVERIGFTPLKGGRHTSHDLVDLATRGPVGDRVFCLVDPSRGRVLRTVENPTLLAACARWEAGVLSVNLPGRTVEGVPSRSGEMLSVDYWGRPAAVERCTGPWAQAYSEYLGRDVVLCRSVTQAEVVYGASVTLVTTSSIRMVAQHLGREVASARFRATFLIDIDDAPPHHEDSWVGRELHVGEATVRVRGVVPRCAVVDLDPETGENDAPVLRELARCRRDQNRHDRERHDRERHDQDRHDQDRRDENRLDQNDSGTGFGVDAVVVAAGRVRAGDSVELGIA